MIGNPISLYLIRSSPRSMFNKTTRALITPVQSLVVDHPNSLKVPCVSMTTCKPYSRTELEDAKWCGWLLQRNRPVPYEDIHIQGDIWTALLALLLLWPWWTKHSTRTWMDWMMVSWLYFHFFQPVSTRSSWTPDKPVCLSLCTSPLIS